MLIVVSILLFLEFKEDIMNYLRPMKEYFIIYCLRYPILKSMYIYHKTMVYITRLRIFWVVMKRNNVLPFRVAIKLFLVDMKCNVMLLWLDVKFLWVDMEAEVKLLWLRMETKVKLLWLEILAFMERNRF